MVDAEFHVHADVAFFLARPMFNHMINTKFDELRRGDKEWKKRWTMKYFSMKFVDEIFSRSVAEKHVTHAEAAQLVMTPIIEAVIPHFAAKVRNNFV